MGVKDPRANLSKSWGRAQKNGNELGTAGPSSPKKKKKHQSLADIYKGHTRYKKKGGGKISRRDTTRKNINN